MLNGLLQDAAAAGAPANETEAVEYEEVTKTRKKVVRLPLTIGGPGPVMPGMGAEQFKVQMAPMNWLMLPCLFSDAGLLNLQPCSPC